MEQGDVIALVITKANLVGDLEEWVLDIVPSRHLCSNRDLFKEFKAATEGEQVLMGNSRPLVSPR